jgi:hypothetical protein
MLVIEMSNPNSVAIQSFEVTTDRGTVVVSEGEPCSLVIDHDGHVCLGNGGTVLRVEHNTGRTDLLKMLSPAEFGLVVEDDGEVSLCATLTGDFKRSESRFDNVVNVISIRPFGGLSS